MKQARFSKKFGPVIWQWALFSLLFGLAWGTIPGLYRSWRARREYDQHYASLLELPSSISRPKAYLQRLPGVVGKALWIDFYQPNADEDGKLRDWFVKHDGFSEFKPRNPKAPNGSDG